MIEKLTHWHTRFSTAFFAFDGYSCQKRGENFLINYLVIHRWTTIPFRLKLFRYSAVFRNWKTQTALRAKLLNQHLAQSSSSSLNENAFALLVAPATNVTERSSNRTVGSCARIKHQMNTSRWCEKVCISCTNNPRLQRNDDAAKFTEILITLAFIGKSVNPNFTTFFKFNQSLQHHWLRFIVAAFEKLGLPL